ncbi:MULTISPECIES: acetylornithine transaminase [Corynebacterium]|jgi:acetylornithine aminotransferase|uniref:Acetylornithine aminotransferase n=1 Tax=Corynebacterium provencense TaxID=1737425 RepID=A0A2Z3YNW3_9CORY|nr:MULTISPECIES: acetylornithine transaminase [Corynebacterium]AWT26312.1 Acetylornithine aminotransferase [Corynebacterium provencense]MCI1256619.1 acetylornithine transaminase [Corynebacterium provencense]
MPDNRTNDWKTAWEAAVMPTYGTPAIELVSGKGSRVTDSEGREYIDLLAGIAVNALGHAHPAVVRAVSEQIATLGHTSNIFAHPQVIALANKLRGLISPDAHVFFSNSGAEANEAAFKTARLTGRSRILAAEHGFHGRTMGSLAMTGQPGKRAPFEPMPAGVEFYPYGDLDALRELILVAPDDTAAVILESVQGETGVVPAPDGFLTGVRELCDEFGVLMIVDEVQAGMGRTGRWFGYQVEDVLPDVVTLAKGLGGGLPIGACVAATPAGQLLSAGQHGSTFGGNPVSCAAGNAVIDTVIAENILDNVNRQGEYLRTALGDLDAVDHVRGRGLMLGVVLREPRPGFTARALEAGLLLNQPAEDVLRLVPPLNITDTDVREAVAVLKELLK